MTRTWLLDLMIPGVDGLDVTRAVAGRIPLADAAEAMRPGGC